MAGRVSEGQVRGRCLRLCGQPSKAAGRTLALRSGSPCHAFCVRVRGGELLDVMWAGPFGKTSVSSSVDKGGEAQTHGLG